MKNMQSGFTLLEMLIALVIVAILARMAIPGFSKAIERTKVKEAQSVLAAIYSAEKIYRLDQGSYGRLDTTLVADDLIRLRYISNPDAGNSDIDWNFQTVMPAGPPYPTFVARATRTGGGGYNGRLIVLDQGFDGTHYNGAGSDHPLRDS